MSRLKTTFVALTLTTLVAGAQTAQALELNNTRVTQVQTYKDAIFLTLASGHGTTCPKNNVVILPNASGHSAFAQEVAVILAAFLSGRTVDVWLEGCAAAPSGGDQVPFVKYFTVK